MIVTGYKKCRTAFERKTLLRKLFNAGFRWSNNTPLFPEPEYVYPQIIIAFDASAKEVWYGGINHANLLTVDPNLV